MNTARRHGSLAINLLVFFLVTWGAAGRAAEPTAGQTAPPERGQLDVRR